MPKILAILVLGAASVPLLACSSPTGPVDDFQLPEEDLSLDPDRLVLGDYIATPCNLQYPDGMDHLWGQEDWALVDVFFGRASALGPWDGPTSDDVALVRSHGGRVLHKFHVPAVRARLVLSRIPGLIQDGYWVEVRDVPDASRYDLPISVRFKRSLELSDVNLYEGLGGRVDHRWDFINTLAGVLPNRSIPALRDRSDVESVHTGSSYCRIPDYPFPDTSKDAGEPSPQ